MKKPSQSMMPVSLASGAISDAPMWPSCAIYITRRNKGILSPFVLQPQQINNEVKSCTYNDDFGPTNFDHLGHCNMGIIKQLLRKVTFCFPLQCYGSSSSFEIQIESVSMVHLLQYPIRDLIYYSRDQSTSALLVDYIVQKKKKKKQSNSTTTTTTTISISYKI